MRTGVARAAALLVGLTAVSQVLGFGRDVVVAAVFGAGPMLDAFFVAQGLMNLVLALMAGAVARAMVPTVSRAVADGDAERAHRTVRTLLTLTVLVLLSASALMALLAQPLVALMAPGFDRPTQDLAVTLTRVVLVATLFVAGTDLLAGYAQAHGRFFLSGVQGIPFNLVMIAAAAGLGPVLGVEALAVGFVVGSAVRLVLQVVATHRVGLRLVPRLQVRDPDVVEVLRLVPALLVITALSNVNTLVDRAVGSLAGEGVITALNLAWRTVSLVDSLLVVTVVAALYPAFGAAARHADRAPLRSLVDRSFRVLTVLITPVVVVLLVLPVPVVAVLFGRGGFDEADVRATATAVLFFAVGALALALRSLASRACLAVGDSRGPVVAAVVAMLVNVVGDLTLGRWFGVAGIAVSTTASLVVAAVLVGVRLQRRHHALSGRGAVLALLRTGTAAVVAGAAAAAALVPLGPASNAATADAVVQVVVGGGVVLAVYVAVLLVLRSPELADGWTVLRRQVLRRAG